LRGLSDYRLQLSRIITVCSIVMTVVLLAELSMIPAWPHIPRPWLISHPWLWRHSDDKSLLSLFIDSWAVAIGLLFISLGGLGKLRRVSFLISGANVIGFPALFFALLTLGRW
jgi:hypothetical protein